MTQQAPPVSIRAATGDDAPVIHALLSELAEITCLQHKFHSSPEQLQRFLTGDRPMFEALLAVAGDDVIGLALYFYTFSSWRGEPGVYLQDIVVTRAARGTGTGERLLRELARVARARGATHLRLAVDRANTDAHRFYERLGLHIDEADHIYAIDGDAFLDFGSNS